MKNVSKVPAAKSLRKMCGECRSVPGKKSIDPDTVDVSTLPRWQAFEIHTYRKLKEMVRSATLPFPEECTKVLWCRRYPTLAGTMKEVDVSIEVCNPLTRRRLFFVVVECKRYSALTAVDTHVIGQLKSAMCLLNANMGILVSRGKLSEGTLAEARAYGISVIRIDWRKDVEWLT